MFFIDTLLDFREVSVLGGHCVLLCLRLPLHLHPAHEALQREPRRVRVLVSSFCLLERSHESELCEVKPRTKDSLDNVYLCHSKGQPDYPLILA